MRLRICSNRPRGELEKRFIWLLAAITIPLLLTAGNGQSSEPDMTSLSDAVLQGGIVARGRIVRHTDIFVRGTKRICGFVYEVEPKEVLAGVHPDDRTFSVFARLNHEIEDYSVDYLIIANAWDVGRDVPMAELARSMAQPGDNFCAPERADYILEKLRQSMFPFRTVPKHDGEWLEETGPSVLSNATMVRMIRVRLATRVRLYYLWEDIRYLVNSLQD